MECLRLARKFRTRPIELLHTNNTGCEESAVAARLAGIPRVVGTFHVDATYDLEGTRSGLRYRVLEYLSNHCLHKAIAVSEATKANWMGRTRLSANRIVTIHNGIDPERFQRRTGRIEARQLLGLPGDDRLILGGVGRLDEAKGFTYLLDGFAELVRDYPNTMLAIAGDGPLRGPLEKQASRLGIADRVRFLGFCRDVQRVYDALDVFVLSSLCEALPYALLEAMATRLPVVGTTVAGVPEVIIQGETGFLVGARDANALAGAIRPLLDSPELRERMGQAGRERVVRHFNEADAVQKTISVYREMLGRRPNGQSIGSLPRCEHEFVTSQTSLK
jgi:glycosyltransferase involved in cell wall biosynthesis